MSDLYSLKEEIYNCGLVVPLLESMGCSINQSTSSSERIEASRPGGNNNRSVQVYLNEYLSSRVRSKSHVPVQDIIDLVSYIRFEQETAEELRKCIPKSKKYIIETLNLTQFDSNHKNEIQNDPNAWLKEIQKRRKQRIDLDEIELNPILPETVMNEFINVPHIGWLNDGIAYEIQEEFEIGFDLQSERIIFPVRNRNGEIVGIKGRSTRLEDEKQFKYLPIYAFQKSRELFNLHRALPYILERNEIILWESEKSCFKSYQAGVKHTVSQMGSDISKIQAEIIKRINPEVKVILGYDSDKTVQEIRQMAKVFGDYEHVYAIVDTKGLLGEKMSPADSEEVILNELLTNHCYKVFP
ncbi:DNA primase [Oceanobacillus sp. FSL H7-0719]|uniref:DNA primase n=1 Tax=Oceanobacillus sp. FSL H7-0719 TaxID=2954507 RepID=UPI00324870A4